MVPHKSHSTVAVNAAEASEGLFRPLSPERLAEGAAWFNEREQRDDGATVLRSLSDGLSLLRDLLYVRVHVDVEQALGADSILVPVSASRTEQTTKLDVELFQIAEAAHATQKYGLVHSAVHDFTHWLLEARLGSIAQHERIERRVRRYLELDRRERTLLFSNYLVRDLGEAGRAPLVLFQLLPLAVAVVTCVAFHRHDQARDARREQHQLLPSVGDCHRCSGQPLENGESCAECGNPVWHYKWLTEE